MDTARGVAAQAERSANQVACLRFLSGTDGAQTVGVISAETGLSRPTVHAVLDDLLEANLVVPTDPATAGPGRPARAFRFAREAGLVAGVDLGPRGVRAIICDLSGRRVAYTELLRRPDVSLIQRAVHTAAKESSIDLDRLRAVGVALPGVIETNGDLRASLALPELVGLPIADIVSQDLGRPVAVDNDIKLAALAEQRVGAGRGYSDVVYLQIGQRLSVSIVLNGVIRQGRHRLAGELGAQRGMRWTRNAQRGQLIWTSHSTSQDVLRAAAAGDTNAQAEVQDFCTQIAGRIAGVLLVVDPEVVVVRGGGRAEDTAALLRPLEAAVEQELVFPERPPFVASALGREAVVLGAVGMAFDRFSTRIFGVHGYPSPWTQLTQDLERTSK
ncbi:ROK family transcriptional regulator [Kribbella kalugense]|uniref:Putative NBD/HSP70 family sugar kinase n=1 Tax=Kribbella kalugense TaxID=2512221 RepID=A0A4R7ZZV9_9ACTN|nr:ROK family transcriptional regulator [Kribbella kalugense]TDW22518.1 putative NBD/HSP70 family sugar kinase [Kribbella kalugense]